MFDDIVIPDDFFINGERNDLADSIIKFKESIYYDVLKYAATEDTCLTDSCRAVIKMIDALYKRCKGDIANEIRP